LYIKELAIKQAVSFVSFKVTASSVSYETR